MWRSWPGEGIKISKNNGNVVDLKLEKDKREGNNSPKVLLSDVQKWIDDGCLEDMVIICKTSDDKIRTSTTATYDHVIIGLIEIAKDAILEDV